MGTGTPAVRVIVPLSTRLEGVVHASITLVPFTHSRTPSSEVVEKVYVCEYRGTTAPLQRTENVSAPMPDTGAPAPHENATFSSRLTVVPVKSWLSKYAPCSPRNVS